MSNIPLISFHANCNCSSSANALELLFLIPLYSATDASVRKLLFYYSECDMCQAVRLKNKNAVEVMSRHLPN
jgi:hypothetical protein